MLSKVAERVYWTARYLERIESTARLISIYDQLLFDLPRSVNLSWYNLITINSLEEAFDAHYSVRDERNVMRFMLGDEANSSSVISSLRAIRENVRTTRDVLPEEIWEMTNELYMFVQENMQQGVGRSKRHQFLQSIIKGCQQMLGMLYGNMPHDTAWLFMRMGLNLERADMTSRNLDAGMAAMLEIEDEETAVNSHQIIWGNVLRALNADQSYRRKTHLAVRGGVVVEYLLDDEELPRSIRHCLRALANSCNKLPKGKAVAQKLREIEEGMAHDFAEDNLDYRVREYLNQLQIEIAKVHHLIGATWFPQCLV